MNVFPFRQHGARDPEAGAGAVYVPDRNLPAIARDDGPDDREPVTDLRTSDRAFELEGLLPHGREERSMSAPGAPNWAR